MRDRLRMPKREGEILNSLRRELDVRRQQAAWYWDTEHGVGYVSNSISVGATGSNFEYSYVCQFPDYNP